jgi:uncharacterized protein YdhG (YjbR/CyaY superfamily)
LALGRLPERITMSLAPKDVDTYLATLPDDQRAALEEVRRTIKAAAPGALEGIGYGIPGYKLKGKPLIYFGAAKNHCAIYGMRAEGLEDDLEGYDMSKGTLRFSPEKPLPTALVRKLVKARMKEIETGGPGRKKSQQ